MDDLFQKKELIYTIYQEKSFSRAAQKLFISQPSLSATVRRVEEAIGQPLFDRSCKPIRLTEVGRAYIQATEQLRHVERAFYNHVCAVNDLQAGMLVIGSNQLFSSLVLPRYVSNFLARYPGVQLNLVDANSAELEQGMISGQLDMIVDNRELDPTQFEKQDLLTEYLLLAVPDSFAANDAAKPYRLSYQDILSDRHTDPATKPVPLSLFANEPYILMTRDNDTRERSDAIFQDAGFRPHILLEIDRLVTLYHFIVLGAAAVVVSDTLIKYVRDAPDNVSFYKLPNLHAQREVYIHCKRTKYQTRAMQAFVQILRES